MNVPSNSFLRQGDNFSSAVKYEMGPVLADVQADWGASTHCTCAPDLAMQPGLKCKYAGHIQGAIPIDNKVEDPVS